MEKSRAIRQAKDERTFHIFYQLLRGATAKERADFLIEDFKTYHYLSNSYIAIQGLDEVEEYNNTIKAMHIMGMSNDDITCKSKESQLYFHNYYFFFSCFYYLAILRTVSGVLQFGNLQFKQERNSDQATLPENTGKK